jgi:Pyruvate/2-oxoacid:ferredoxin oxidoreductase delta subunit
MGMKHKIATMIMVMLAGCTSTALTGEPNLAEETYSVDAVADAEENDVYSIEAEHVPDVTADVTVDAPVPDCGDCMATSCSDCWVFCPDVGCVELDELNCGVCGVECADGLVCVGRDIDDACAWECVDGHG